MPRSGRAARPLAERPGPLPRRPAVVQCTWDDNRAGVGVGWVMPVGPPARAVSGALAAQPASRPLEPRACPALAGRPPVVSGTPAPADGGSRPRCRVKRACKLGRCPWPCRGCDSLFRSEGGGSGFAVASLQHLSAEPGTGDLDLRPSLFLGVIMSGPWGLFSGTVCSYMLDHCLSPADLTF